jgi:hypothetical protein
MESGKHWRRRQRQLNYILLRHEQPSERQFLRLACRFRKAMKAKRTEYYDDCSRVYNSGPLETSYHSCGSKARRILREGKLEYFVLHSVNVMPRIRVFPRKEWMLRLAFAEIPPPPCLLSLVYLEETAQTYKSVCVMASEIKTLVLLQLPSSLCFLVIAFL